ARLQERIPRAAGGARRPRPSTAGIREDLLAPRPGPMSGLQAAVIGAQWRRRARLRQAQEAVATRLIAALESSGEVVPLVTPRQAVHLLPCLVRPGADPATAHRLRLALYDRGVQTE